MSLVDTELCFVNKLLDEFKLDCVEYISSSRARLAEILSTASIELEDKQEINLQPQQKRALDLSPSPTRKSPVSKKPLINDSPLRPRTAPYLQRVPLKEVKTNSPKLEPKSRLVENQDTIDTSVSFKRGSQSPCRSPTRSPAQTSRVTEQSPSRAPRSPTKLPVKRADQQSTFSRLMLPTVSSLQHARNAAQGTPLAKKNDLHEFSTLQLSDFKPLATFKAPTVSKLHPPTITTPGPMHGGVRKTSLSNKTTPFRTNIPVAPMNISTLPSPGQISLPEISDFDDGGSVLLDWAVTPEIAKHTLEQAKVAPNLVFGARAPPSIRRMFNKPGRARTSSACWDRDGLTREECEAYAEEIRAQAPHAMDSM